MLIECITAIST